MFAAQNNCLPTATRSPILLVGYTLLQHSAVMSKPIWWDKERQAVAVEMFIVQLTFLHLAPHPTHTEQILQIFPIDTPKNIQATSLLWSWNFEFLMFPPPDIFQCHFKTRSVVPTGAVGNFSSKRLIHKILIPMGLFMFFKLHTCFSAFRSEV